MAVTHNWFGPGLENILNGTIDLVSDTIKVALFKEAYSPAEADENYVDTHECDSEDYLNEGGAGAGEGGQTLPITATEINYDTGEVKIKTSVAAGETVFTSEGTISAYYAVIYSETPATSKLISWVDFGGEEASTDGEYKITWTNGELQKFNVNPT